MVDWIADHEAWPDPHYCTQFARSFSEFLENVLRTREPLYWLETGEPGPTSQVNHYGDLLPEHLRFPSSGELPDPAVWARWPAVPPLE